MELLYSAWNPTNPTKRIVLLHGLGGTGALWKPLGLSLEEHMAVLAPDQRGHGKSRPTHSGGFTPMDYGQDVVDTLAATAFHPTWILGHSMGVRTAVAAASLKPNWCQGLILVDLGFKGIAGGGLGNNLAVFLKKLPDEFPNREEAKTFMMANCPDPSIVQYLLAVSVKEPSGRLTFPFDRLALVETVEAARNFTIKPMVEDLAQRKMPILVLRGANSLVWSHEEFEAEKQSFSQYPSVVFEEVPEAGHGLPFEQRAKLVARILALIGTKEPKP